MNVMKNLILKYLYQEITNMGLDSLMEVFKYLQLINLIILFF